MRFHPGLGIGHTYSHKFDTHRRPTSQNAEPSHSGPSVNQRQDGHSDAESVNLEDPSIHSDAEKSMDSMDGRWEPNDDSEVDSQHSRHESDDNIGDAEDEEALARYEMYDVDDD